jgi:hypothetical protein
MQKVNYIRERRIGRKEREEGRASNKERGRRRKEGMDGAR